MTHVSRGRRPWRTRPHMADVLATYSENVSNVALTPSGSLDVFCGKA